MKEERGAKSEEERRGARRRTKKREEGASQHQRRTMCVVESKSVVCVLCFNMSPSVCTCAAFPHASSTQRPIRRGPTTQILEVYVCEETRHSQKVHP